MRVAFTNPSDLEVYDLGYLISSGGIFSAIWDFLKIYCYKEPKWFVQRGWRGYADCDWWHIADYNSKVMIELLKYYKQHRHGSPCLTYENDEDGQDFHCSVCKTKHANCECTHRIWDAYLDKMILSFQLCDEDNDDFEWQREKGETMDEYTQREKEREKQIEEGLTLMAKYYRHLWD